MILVLNILTKTKRGDVYDEVAINKYPIVISIDGNCDIDEWLDEFLGSDDFSRILSNHIRNRATFDNSKLYIRIYDDGENKVDDRVIIIADKINDIQVWEN